MKPSLTFRSIKYPSFQMHTLDAAGSSIQVTGVLHIRRLRWNDVRPLRGHVRSAQFHARTRETSESSDCGGGVTDRLDGEGLGHDWAATGDDLEVGHGTAAIASSGSSSGGAQRSEGGSRRLREERA